MSLQIQKASDVVTASLARWGIYGDNGTGKTTFLRTLCRCKPGEKREDCIPTLVVSADQENVKPLTGAEHIRVAKIEDWKQLQDILLLLRNPKNPYKAVAFDTWTRLQGLAINMIIGYQPKTDEEVIKYLVAAPRTPQGYIQWQQIGALSSEWMRYFMRVPVHSIFLFQEAGKTEDGDDGKIYTVAPALTKSALQTAKEALELVGRLYVEPATNGSDNLLEAATADRRTIDPNTKEVRKLLLGKHPIYFAKGPTHILGYVVEQPDWTKLAASLT